ncbi:ABC transporter ATP-binding protein [Ruegeria halocynthiae]|uniref:ABC transporter ATP-binding protein n=1 Tax=Ruegeria halocynthiae TaxID=985054 RepID=UPI0009E055B8
MKNLQLIPASSPDPTADQTAPSDFISIRNVTKRFGSVTALEDVSLDIAEGEFFTLLGPSGCGKTTLLRLLAGFEYPSTGEISLSDFDLTRMPPNKRPVNTVFQSYALFPHLDVLTNVAFGLERLGEGRKAAKQRALEMLDMVQLTGFEYRLANELSGGQQQRVALARALAPRPRILLLDEPLSALDLKLRRGMQSELKRLQRATGITFVLVTHDQEEALSMSDRIAVMSDGKLLQVGAPLDIYDAPRNRFVAEFVGEANVLPGRMLGLASPYGAIRPERVIVRQGGAGSCPGRVLSVVFVGSVAEVEIQLNTGQEVKARLVDGWQSLNAGEVVQVEFPHQHARTLEDR